MNKNISDVVANAIDLKTGEKIHVDWSSVEFGSALIKSTSLSIGGQELGRWVPDGKGGMEADIIHVGAPKTKCPWCSSTTRSGEDLVYFYGTAHVYNPDQECWEGRQGVDGNIIDVMSDAMIEVWRELKNK